MNKFKSEVVILGDILRRGEGSVARQKDIVTVFYLTCLLCRNVIANLATYLKKTQ